MRQRILSKPQTTVTALVAAMAAARFSAVRDIY